MSYPAILRNKNGIGPDIGSCRFVPTFNGVDQSGIFPEITLTGDYFAEVKIIFDGTVDIRPWGRTAGLNNRLFIGSDGRVNWRAGNSSTNSYILNAGAVTAGTKRIRVERTGSLGELFINGVSQGTQTVTTSDAMINAVQNNGGSLGSGIVYNLNFNNIQIMKLNDGFINDPNIKAQVGTDGTVENMTSASWSEICE